MAVQILSQSYGPRKPFITCTADSLSDLEGLVCAEGSTATVGGTEYVLDRVNGWVEPGSGGGGGSTGGVFVVYMTVDQAANRGTLDKTWQEIYDAAQNGMVFLTASPAMGLEVKVFDGWLNTVDNSRGYSVTFSEVWVENTSVSGGAITLYAETADGYPSGSL